MKLFCDMWREAAPDIQALAASIFMVLVLGAIVGFGFAWLRPAHWMSATALGCGAAAIGFSVLGMRILQR